MKNNKNFETYTQELLDLVSCLTKHTAYKDFQHVSDKIKDAIQNGNLLTIHSEYPFLTDMFFHIIIAELKTQSEWLDWLWENNISPIAEKDRYLCEEVKYSSFAEMLSTHIQTDNKNSLTDTSISAKCEEYFKINLREMKEYLEAGTADFDIIKEHIILAKFQLKFIAYDKRNEYLTQYIAVLKKMRDLSSVQESGKLVRIIDFFVGKYENIPMNFCNDDEFSILGAVKDDTSLSKNFFKSLLLELDKIRKKHNEQTGEIDRIFSNLGRCDNTELKNACQHWNAVSKGNVHGQIQTLDAAYASYIKYGIDAQKLLHNICANRYYHIDNYGSGKIQAKHLQGRFDRTGQLFKVDYQSDGIAMDTFIHIINCKMYEYLDGEHSDTYLTSIIDNVCALKIDNYTGARRKHKASGENVSTNAPIENPSDGKRTHSLEDSLPAQGEASVEYDYRRYVLKTIKKYSTECYLYLLLLYHGVTLKTLSALRNNGFAAQAESLTVGQELEKQEILEIIGKGGNGHFFERELEKLRKMPEFKEIQELRDLSQEIVRFLNRK